MHSTEDPKNLWVATAGQRRVELAAQNVCRHSQQTSHSDMCSCVHMFKYPHVVNFARHGERLRRLLVFISVGMLHGKGDADRAREGDSLRWEDS